MGDGNRMSRWVSGLGVALVYMHLRSRDLSARVQAAAEKLEPEQSATAVTSASIRSAHEHSGKGVEFAPGTPADTVDLLRKKHAEHLIYMREFNARRT
jgi:hypothetical protein